MSKLNAQAFAFVPGKFKFAGPAQTAPPEESQPVAPPESDSEPDSEPEPEPAIAQEQVKAATVSIAVGSSSAAPNSKETDVIEANTSTLTSTSTLAPPAASSKTTPVSNPSNTNVTVSSQSYNFTSEKSKTDTDAIALDVQKLADAETLGDLYGKQHLNIVFIGHVDAGKSTMGGNLLYITGMVDKRTMEKYEREAKEMGRDSWYLSWALDSTPQERAKGKTVEVGRAYFETPIRRYTILDAPGHKTFVPSMISGAAQADVAILVISARKGEFETGFERGGQTREHIMLVKTVGVSKLIVVINKMDEPTVQWSKERYEEIKDKLVPFIKAAGFNPKTDATFIPVSAYTGINLKDRPTKQQCSWWDGPSLLELLDQMPMVERKLNAPLMVPISEKYKDMGTIIVGKIEAGRVRKGDSLLLMPNRTSVEVSGIYDEREEEMPAGQCGDNVRIRIRGVDDDEITPGFVLTSVDNPVRAVRQFEAQLAILDHKNIICAGYSAVMHVHTLSEDITLTALVSYFDRKTGKRSKKPPQFAKRGQKIIALLETPAPVCVERFVDYPQLGRFTLRDEGKTIAIGKITRLVERDEYADTSYGGAPILNAA